MYYKRDSSKNIRCLKEFKDKYENEFSLALYEKYKELYGKYVRLGSVDIIDNEKKYNKIVVVLDPEFKTLSNEYKKDFRVESLNLIGSFNSLENGKSFRKSINSFKDIDPKKIKEEYKSFSDVHYELAKKELSDFFNIKERGLLYDKNKEEYEYVIIENSDNTIGSNVLVDEVNVLKDGKLIGYVKVKYSSLKIEEECTGIPYSILEKKKINKKEKEIYLKNRNIEYNENNIDILFKILETDTKESLKKYNSIEINKLFNNIATVDYSLVSKGLQGKEIGKEMYLIMGKYLKNKGLKFRNSGLQSESAISLWTKLKEKSPEIIKEEIISGKKFLIMDIPNELDLRNKAKKNRIVRASNN